MTGAVLAGCGDDAPASSSSSVPDGATTTGAATSSTAAVPESTMSDDESSVPDDATRVEVAELLTDGASFVGSRVAVRGKAFFVETCPPPTTAGGAGTCTISLYLAVPERDDLLYAERDQAVPVWDHGARVSCEVVGDVSTACPGWEQARLYELVGRVLAPANDGGRVQLDLDG